MAAAHRALYEDLLCAPSAAKGGVMARIAMF